MTPTSTRELVKAWMVSRPTAAAFGIRSLTWFPGRLVVVESSRSWTVDDRGRVPQSRACHEGDVGDLQQGQTEERRHLSGSLVRGALGSDGARCLSYSTPRGARCSA